MTGTNEEPSTKPTHDGPFQAFAELDLQKVVAATLVAAIQAQAMAAEATLKLVADLKEADGRLKLLRMPLPTAPDEPARELQVPLLALVNLPSIKIDKLSVALDFELSSREDVEFETYGNTTVDATGTLPPSVRLKGRPVSRATGKESHHEGATINVRLEASAAEPPDALLRLVDVLGQVQIRELAANPPEEGAGSGGAAQPAPAGALPAPPATSG